MLLLLTSQSILVIFEVHLEHVFGVNVSDTSAARQPVRGLPFFVPYPVSSFTGQESANVDSDCLY
jgi:hypothetical protein